MLSRSPEDPEERQLYLEDWARGILDEIAAVLSVCFIFEWHDHGPQFEDVLQAKEQGLGKGWIYLHGSTIGVLVTRQCAEETDYEPGVQRPKLPLSKVFTREQWDKLAKFSASNPDGYKLGDYTLDKVKYLEALLCDVSERQFCQNDEEPDPSDD
jgi:hypothetical protein